MACVSVQLCMKQTGALDNMVQADRDGHAMDLAEAYASSDLAATNLVLLEAAAAGRLDARGATSPALLKELATRHETTTPVWFGLKTLLKVNSARLLCIRSKANAAKCDCIGLEKSLVVLVFYFLLSCQGLKMRFCMEGMRESLVLTASVCCKRDLDNTPQPCAVPHMARLA